MKTDCSSCLCPPARAPDWLPGMSPLIPGRSGTSPAASGMSPLVGDIPGLWRGGIPDRLGDIWSVEDLTQFKILVDLGSWGQSRILGSF